MARKARVLTVSDRQRAILERMLRARGIPVARSERVRVVLMGAEGVSTTEGADRLRVNRQRVHRWRHRWAQVEARLAAAEREGVSDRDLEALICEALSDQPRSGTPPRFTPEQMTDIVALACEKPAESGLPVTHWTPAELAREAVRRGIVESISPRHVDRFLKRSRPTAAQKPVLADFPG